MAQQTAVEWFMDKLHASSAYKNMDMKDWNKIVNIFEQAKQMEKKQIIDAFDADVIYGAEKYYEKTYGK